MKVAPSQEFEANPMLLTASMLLLNLQYDCRDGLAKGEIGDGEGQGAPFPHPGTQVSLSPHCLPS